MLLKMHFKKQKLLAQQLVVSRMQLMQQSKLLSKDRRQKKLKQALLLKMRKD
jgi:hypothetical protein